MVVSEASVISEGKFNHLMSAFQMLEKSRNHLEDTAASDFAKLGVLIYFSIGLPIFMWICWLVVQQGWEQIEPFTFIVPVGWILLSYLLQGIFTGQFPSLNPRELFHALKSWKKKQLEKSRLGVSWNQVRTA